MSLRTLLNDIFGSDVVSLSCTLVLPIYKAIICKVKIEFCYPQDENKTAYYAFTSVMTKWLAVAKTKQALTSSRAR